MINKDKAIGSMVGLAIGDALGTSLEFKPRDSYDHICDIVGGGPFNLKAGEWTDDTSMALCISDSLIYKGTFCPHDILNRFIKWLDFGENSHNGKCFDIGAQTYEALNNYEIGGSPYCGSVLSEKSGNGGIMRLAPIPIFFHKDINSTIKYSIDQSRLTHASEECKLHASVLGSIIHNLINETMKIEDLLYNFDESTTRDSIKSTGYVVDTLTAAQWAITNTNNFKDALLVAVNLGGDADTIGAVTGQIAGAMYGFESIPKEWYEILVWNDHIKNSAEKLLDIGSKV